MQRKELQFRYASTDVVYLFARNMLSSSSIVFVNCDSWFAIVIVIVLIIIIIVLVIDLIIISCASS